MQREVEFIEGMQFKNKPHTLNLTEHEGIIQAWLICVDCAVQADCWAEQQSTGVISLLLLWVVPAFTNVIGIPELFYSFEEKLGLESMKLEKIGDSFW